MKEIESIDEFKKYAAEGKGFVDAAFQNLDLSEFEQDLGKGAVKNCLFMGCILPEPVMGRLIKDNNLIFPQLTVPFNPYRNKLYDLESLYGGLDPEDPETYEKCHDVVVYRHYMDNGKTAPSSIYEALARRLHDHSVTDALMDIINKWDPKRIIAIMGGHSLSRTNSDYKKAVLISKKLCEKNYLMLSGGGPGAMEATHLGAWFAERADDELDEAFEILSHAPSYKDKRWLASAFEVVKKFPKKYSEIKDIGIPTWLYGHEPPTIFAARMAKYFANSVREEGLLALARGGIIYSPGSAGTVQEIFQDAAQNHYKSYGFASPMIFLNKKYWTEEKAVYQLAKDLAKGCDYEHLLDISDDVDEIVSRIEQFTAGEHFGSAQ
ncbi:MAG: hypothetical protein GY754_30830 [bacterium]|nr:hypothetical protein [bacterium]